MLDIKYLQERIVFQVLIANKLCNWISLYRSPSQPTDIFDQFADNLELTLDEVGNHNPFLIVLLGDFNVIQKTGTHMTKCRIKELKQIL